MTTFTGYSTGAFDIQLFKPASCLQADRHLLAAFLLSGSSTPIFELPPNRIPLSVLHSRPQHLPPGHKLESQKRHSSKLLHVSLQATRVLEFGLREDKHEARPLTPPHGAGITPKGEGTCRADVTKDLLYVYRNLVERYRPGEGQSPRGGVARALETARGVVLDTKHFVKDYR
jgi:hypothetical protein